MDDVFLSILNQSLTGSIVILAICLARFPLRKAPKMISYCLWAVAGFRLAFPFSIESVFSLMPIAAQPIPAEVVRQAVPRIPSIAPVAGDFVRNALPAVQATPSVHPPEIWTTIGLCVWIAGMLALMTYGIVSFLKLKRKMRGAAPLGGNLYETDGPPFVLGLLSPKIYIPAGVAGEERRYIVLHERTHVRRRDHITKFAAWFLVCIHWFNPLAWLAFHLMVQDMEMACDERVLRFLGGDIKRDYSRALVSQAVGHRLWSGSPLAFGEGDMKRRILNVLRFKRTSRIVVALAILAATVLGVGFAVDRVGGAENTPSAMAESALPRSEDFAAKTQAGAFDAHIPQGMRIVTGSLGDVNADGVEDALLSLSADAGGKQASALLVLAGQAGGSYAVATRVTNALPDRGTLQLVAGEGMIELRYDEANGTTDRDTTITRFAYDPGAQDWFLRTISCQPTYAQDGRTASQPVFVRPPPALENQPLSAFSYDAFYNAELDLGAFDLVQSFTRGGYVFAACLQRNEEAGTYEGYVYKNDLAFLNTGDFIQTVCGKLASGEEWDTSSDAVNHTFTVQGDLWAYDEREDAFYLASDRREAAGAADARITSPEEPPPYGEIVPWNRLLDVWPWSGGDPIQVVDFRTREAFSITRVGGTNHVDFEPTTAGDTATLSALYGGAWSWEKRPVLVYAEGRWVAGSIAGLPHGKETIEGNDMEGSLCLHFEGSRLHGDNQVDAEHQAAIREAAGVTDAPPEEPPMYGEVVPWSDVLYEWAWDDGEPVTVIDFRTREAFAITRVGGAEQLEFEPTTAEDTAAIKACYGGAWSWARRPVLVDVDGTWVAASIAGMPHGKESVADNDMEGGLCLYFSGSRDHGATGSDEEHEAAIREAAGVADAPSEPPVYGEIVPWREVSSLWAWDTIAEVIDFWTKERFTVTRIGGVPHADFETTTVEDTAILKDCYDGRWSWNRRPVLVCVEGRWIAASINGYPHGNDALEGNDMAGILCMHFEGSRTEGSGVIDEAHQSAIREAGGAE